MCSPLPLATGNPGNLPWPGVLGAGSPAGGASYRGQVRALVRSVWGEPRPGGAPERVWRDWVLVALLIPAAVLEGLLRRDLEWPVAQGLITAGLVPTLLWRRTRPLQMVVVGFGVTGVAQLVIDGGVVLNTLAFMILLPYSLVRWGSGRDAVLGSPLMLANVLSSAVLGNLTLADMLGGLGILSASMAIGAAFRFRDRARLRELDQVKLLERERLARDLHDTVAHHVSAMAIRAQAGLATAAVRPEAATDALRVIEAEASRALAEMRAMVRLLRRDQPAELMPNPRIADLEQFAGRSGPGPAVDVQISGELDDVPPSVAAAIFRLAQESITNARRHARHATRIEVRVMADDGAVHLRVSDDGEVSPVRPAALPGYGLMGMIERANLLGGTCEAGPGPDRGWTVTAVLPRAGWAT
jgi:signal transduction histidine kinase